MAGCKRSDAPTADVQVSLTLDPSPPVVGEARVVAAFADAQGHPLEVRDVKLEGNMNHAGMQPTFASLKAAGPSKHEGTLQFTMGGDWFILVTAHLPDGRAFERRIDVRGVKPR